MNVPNPGDPLGHDMLVRLDLDPTGRSATGEELTEDAILHRLMADTLPLIDSPHGVQEYGEDVRRWVGEAMDAASASLKGQRLKIILERETRLLAGSIRCTVTPTPLDETYALRIDISARTTTSRPIALVIGVSAVTVALLAQGK